MRGQWKYFIIMEYSVFDFNSFGTNKEVTTLEDFVHFIDDEYDFSSFSEMIPVCAKDVATGLVFLHRRNVAHKYLKLSNVLVSNVHYISKQGLDLRKAFAELPIVCKLVDFGLSRSLQFQDSVSSPDKHKLSRRQAQAFVEHHCTWHQNFIWYPQ